MFRKNITALTPKFTSVSGKNSDVSSQLPHVAVIIVSYNTVKLTLAALESVFASTGVRLSVYIVDNASSDRTLTQLRRTYGVRATKKLSEELRSAVAAEAELRPTRYQSVDQDIPSIQDVLFASVGDHELWVLSSQKNLGFGRANNIASVISTAPYVFYLNSDALVRANTIAQLVAQFTEYQNVTALTTVLMRTQQRLDNLGIVAAELHNPDGSLQIQGGALPTLWNVFSWITFLDDLPGLSHVVRTYQHHIQDMRRYHRRLLSKVGWVGGTACMVTRSCLDEIGGFDPGIFMYGEDVEWCWRATKRHWDVAIATDAKVTHIGSASSGHKNAIHGEIKGLVYMWEKHRSRTELWLLKRILLFGIRLRVLMFGILRRYGQQRIYQEAVELVR